MGRGLHAIRSLLVSAAIAAGAAAGAAGLSADTALACSYAGPPDPIVAVEYAAVILTARVAEVREGEFVRLTPEAFLRGPVETELTLDYYNTTCDLAELAVNDRVLVFLGGSDTGQWPQAYSTYYLRSGFAEHPWDESVRQPESSLISEIRSLTGQYAVPVAANEDGATIDWGKTVLPVTAVIGIVFGVGLVLMRIWHRIDPS